MFNLYYYVLKQKKKIRLFLDLYVSSLRKVQFSWINLQNVCKFMRKDVVYEV